MENESRAKNSIRNIIFQMIGQVVVILLQFVNRRVFVNLLDTEYLGLSGLFSNVLSVLALSELGIGTAMTYALYRPVSVNDIEKIKSLMSLYKKVYTAIGCLVLAIGSLLAPFLQFLIKDMPDIPYIRIYYLLYVLNAGVSYFYTYKRTLIICNQKAFISSTTTTLASVATRALQVVFLIFTRNFFVYLVIQVVVTRLENVVISRIADKYYPFLKDKNIEPLTEEDKKGIVNNVKAMFMHKIGNVVVNATDSLIISKVLGLSSVGLFSNYMLIFDNVKSISCNTVTSTAASVGNLIAQGDKEKTYRIYKNMVFANFWIMGFCATCLTCLAECFINVWLGAEFLLGMPTVIVLVLCFYFAGMRMANNVFKEAAGLFRQDRFKPLVEAVLNLAVSIPLTCYYGTMGVKLGTVISTLLVPFWLEAYIVYKHLFNKNVWNYILMQVKYSLITAVLAGLTWFVCSLIPFDGIPELLIRGIICCIVPNALLIAIFFKTDSFAYFKDMVLKKIRPKTVKEGR